MSKTIQVLPIEHIVYHPQKKKPVIAGTVLSVAFLSGFLNKPEWTAERIAQNYELTPAQVYAAWAYYYDHQAEIDAQLETEGEHPWLLGTDINELRQR